MRALLLVAALVACASRADAKQAHRCDDDEEWVGGLKEDLTCKTYGTAGYWKYCERDGADVLKHCPTACRTKECYVDCKWTKWTEWGDAAGFKATPNHLGKWVDGADRDGTTCTKACGGGKQGRSRKILHKLDIQTYAAPCPHTEESRLCNSHPCPIDCKLTQWSDWSKCSVGCGGGTRTRTREVVVKPEHGGKVCEALSATEKCNEHVCQNSFLAKLKKAAAACPALNDSESGCLKDCGQLEGASLGCDAVKGHLDATKGCMKDCPACVQAFYGEIGCEAGQWSKWCAGPTGPGGKGTPCCNTCIGKADNGVCDDDRSTFKESKTPMWTGCAPGTDCTDCLNDPNWGKKRWQESYKYVVSAATKPARRTGVLLVAAAAVLLMVRWH